MLNQQSMKRQQKSRTSAAFSHPGELSLGELLGAACLAQANPLLKTKLSLQHLQRYHHALKECCLSNLELLSHLKHLSFQFR